MLFVEFESSKSRQERCRFSIESFESKGQYQEIGSLGDCGSLQTRLRAGTYMVHAGTLSQHLAQHEVRLNPGSEIRVKFCLDKRLKIYELMTKQGTEALIV